MKIITDGRRHLVCVPYSKRNLHSMARSLSLGKHWFHRDHYDIPKMRVQEIESKALLVSPKVVVRLIKAHNNPSRKLRMEAGMPSSTTENHDHEALLYERFRKDGKKGVHFCPEWDYMAIHEGSPEFEACLCSKESIYQKS